MQYDQQGRQIVAEAAITQITPMTPSATVTYAPGKQFAVNATTAGNVTVIIGGQSFTWPVPIGTSIFPWAVTRIDTSSTAVATYYNFS